MAPGFPQSQRDGFFLALGLRRLNGAQVGSSCGRTQAVVQALGVSVRFPTLVSAAHQGEDDLQLSGRLLCYRRRRLVLLSVVLAASVFLPLVFFTMSFRQSSDRSHRVVACAGFFRADLLLRRLDLTLLPPTTAAIVFVDPDLTFVSQISYFADLTFSKIRSELCSIVFTDPQCSF